MTLMEIRAKARRLKQRHDLKLIVIDYLQLMTSGKKVESPPAGGLRVLPALKLLAKELEVPVIAISPAQPWPRAAHRQAAPDVRPARVGLPAPPTPGSCAPTPAPRSTIGELMASGASGRPGVVARRPAAASARAP